MITFVLHGVNGNQVCCHSLCLESDYEELKKDPLYLNNFKAMDETLFRILYLNEYSSYVHSDVISCICIWIEQLYRSEKKYTIDEDCIFTDSYLIQTVDKRVTITFYIGCSVKEAVDLVLHLKEKLEGTDFSLEIHHTTVFGCLCEN